MSLYNSILKKGLIINKNGTAIVCDGIRYSYDEFDQKVTNFAIQLKEIGVSKGSKVMICIENPLDFVIALFSISLIGAVIMPIYAKTGIDKIEAVIKDYDINFIIRNNSNDRLFLEYFSLDKNLAIYRYSDKVDISLNNIKLILFTSGTTSIPKAIMLSTDNICSNVQAISNYLKLRPEDNILLIKDLSHSSSIIGELFVGLKNGCTIILTSKLPTTTTILRLMDQENISIFFAVPTLLKAMMVHDRLHTYNLSNLRVINFYGAAMPMEDILRLINTFETVNIIYSYGQTEASPRITYIEKNDLLKHPGSCGKAIENVEVQIVDPNGNKVQAGVQGEITISGPNVMQGYYRNEEKTKSTIRNNRLFTGDIGMTDQEGFLYVTGRMDNMIISAGKNIYMEEIEGVLLTYECILEALILAKQNENSTYQLVGYVVVKKGVILDKSRLFVYLRDRLENYKIPKDIVIVDSLQKTASGKILRKQRFQ